MDTKLQDRIDALSPEQRATLEYLLDEQVHECKASEASTINNAGLGAQAEYLGEDWVLRVLDDILEELVGSDNASSTVGK